MGKGKDTQGTDTNVVELDPTKLTLDPEVQPREKVTKSLVEQYAEDMKAGDVFPPVVAFRDGNRTWIADGFHRTEAAVRAGLTEIRVEVHEGGKRDAILYAAGANATHGQRRSNKDKRRAVERLLTDKKWGKRSDRWIARQCRVSNGFVSKLKKELSVHGSQMDGTRTVTRGGKTYEMDTSRIGSQGGVEEESDEGSGQEDDDPGSAVPDDPEEPDEEITSPPVTEDGFADDSADDLVGALDDILLEVRGDDGDGDGDDQEGGESEDESGAADESDDEVESEGGEVPEVQEDEPDDVGDTTDSTDSDDIYSSTSRPAPPPATAPPTSTARWAVVKVSEATFNDGQAAAVREYLDGDIGGSCSHVLVLRGESETGGYMAYKKACEVVGQAGFRWQFRGQLLLSEKAMVYATVACREGGHDDPVELLRHVLGRGSAGMEDVPVGGEVG